MEHTFHRTQNGTSVFFVNKRVGCIRIYQQQKPHFVDIITESYTVWLTPHICNRSRQWQLRGRLADQCNWHKGVLPPHGVSGHCWWCGLWIAPLFLVAESGTEWKR
jgi:hypothetical protein